VMRLTVFDTGMFVNMLDTSKETSFEVAGSFAWNNFVDSSTEFRIECLALNSLIAPNQSARYLARINKYLLILIKHIFGNKKLKINSNF